MKSRSRILAILLVLGLVPLAAFPQEEAFNSPDQSIATQPNNAVDPGFDGSGYEILSDARRAPQELGRYVDRVLTAIRAKWYERIPPDRLAFGPTATEIDVTIKRYGLLRAVTISQTSADTSLDTAAMEGIRAAAPFESLPEKWPEKSLSLRFHFLYNQDSTPDRPACGRQSFDAHRLSPKINFSGAVFTPDPEYSEEARKAKYQGTLTLGGTVEPDGSFGDICILQLLGYRPDEKAIEVVKQWKFRPAMKDLQPVPVRISVEVSFHLY
jgi:TonB family protein